MAGLVAGLVAGLGAGLAFGLRGAWVTVWVTVKPATALAAGLAFGLAFGLAGALLLRQGVAPRALRYDVTALAYALVGSLAYALGAGLVGTLVGRSWYELMVNVGAGLAFVPWFLLTLSWQPSDPRCRRHTSDDLPRRPPIRVGGRADYLARGRADGRSDVRVAGRLVFGLTAGLMFGLTRLASGGLWISEKALWAAGRVGCDS